jgi:hypothetical protein
MHIHSASKPTGSTLIQKYGVALDFRSVLKGFSLDRTSTDSAGNHVDNLLNMGSPPDTFHRFSGLLILRTQQPSEGNIKPVNLCEEMDAYQSGGVDVRVHSVPNRTPRSPKVQRTRTGSGSSSRTKAVKPPSQR